MLPRRGCGTGVRADRRYIWLSAFREAVRRIPMFCDACSVRAGPGGSCPGVGDFVTADDGLKGEVQSVNVLRQLVKVIVTVNHDEKEIREYKVEQLRFKPRRRKKKADIEDAELKKLEALERQEGKSKIHG